MSFVLRYLAGRIIKLVGNALKGPCYVVHWIAPKLRFSIPHYSGPLIRTRAKHRIPRIIWQTNFTDRVTLAIYLNYLFNRLISPTYEYRFMLDDERTAFIRENYSAEILDYYSRLQIGAARADFWRVLALQKFGGVYLDIDGHVVWPLGFIIPHDARELYLIDRNKKWTNCFIASDKDNPHLDLVIAKILANLKDPPVNGVFTLTGPGVFIEVLQPMNLPAVDYKYTCFQGTFSNRFFQYIDHPQGVHGKWLTAQRSIAVVKGTNPGPLPKAAEKAE